MWIILYLIAMCFALRARQLELGYTKINNPIEIENKIGLCYFQAMLFFVIPIYSIIQYVSNSLIYLPILFFVSIIVASIYYEYKTLVQKTNKVLKFGYFGIIFIIVLTISLIPKSDYNFPTREHPIMKNME